MLIHTEMPRVSDAATSQPFEVSGLELRGVSKSYGAAMVCGETSFSVPFGAFVCFLGPSGCGKTTLLRMIAGLVPPSSGRILMGGRDITAVPTHERNIGMVFQSLALFPHLNVAENIAYALRMRGVPRLERSRRVLELLDLIRLPDVGRRRIGELSGGQRQRVAIARALAQEPALFLLDEPLSALDAKLRDHMQVELKQLQRKLRITTIFVTHDQREAMTLADRIVVMSEGTVQQIGTPLDVYRKPANRFVAQFIGQNNLFEVAALDRNHVRAAAGVVALDDMPAVCNAQGRLTLSVRPEDLIATAAGAPPPPDTANEQPFAGHVTFVSDLGPTLELLVECAGQTVVCTERSGSARYTIGEPVGLYLRRGCTVLHSE